jgi:hypothetical protein
VLGRLALCLDGATEVALEVGRVSEAVPQDPLKPALKKAEAELARHLDEACETQPDDVSQGSVDELLRLEEELLAAARAADEAVRLRRRLEERGSTDGSAAGAQASQPDDAGGRVREFRDRQGRPWRVWEVRPGLGRPLSELHRYLGDLVNGWLAFDYLDGDIRKRLPKFAPDWLQMSDRELEALLNQAGEVPKRKSL